MEALKEVGGVDVNKKGFTLVEVIIAMAIAGIIAVTFIPLLTSQYVNIAKTGDKSKATYNAIEEAEKDVIKLKNGKEDKVKGDIDGNGKVEIPSLNIDQDVDTVTVTKEEKGEETELKIGVPK